MEPGRIILLIVVALLFEGNFRYYDYKGKMPLSPFRLIYKMLPKSVTGSLRGAGQWWGRVVHGRVPVTLLPDHVLLCVQKTIAWEDAEPGSPEGSYKEDVERVVRSVARRHTQPGMTFDENGFHYDSGGWIAYTYKNGPEVYASGNRFNVPVYLMDYWGVGLNFRCGNTYGHEEGPEHYRSYAVTFEGDFVKAD